LRMLADGVRTRVTRRCS